MFFVNMLVLLLNIVNAHPKVNLPGPQTVGDVFGKVYICSLASVKVRGTQQFLLDERAMDI